MNNRHNQEWNPRHSVITGASSGLGAGLAQGLAAEGRELTLIARRTDKLEEIASRCTSLGSTVHLVTGDVRDRASMASIMKEADRHCPIDLVIANAGIGGGPGVTADDIYAINMDGVRFTVEPAIELMVERGHGQIAIMSSLAGFRGMPGAPAYSASKNFARAYGEAMQGRWRASGIDVSVICPGFVDTDMTRSNPFPMPFLMSEEKARNIMLKGLSRRKSRIAYPLPTYLFCALLPLLPTALVERMLADQESKET